MIGDHHRFGILVEKRPGEVILASRREQFRQTGHDRQHEEHAENGKQAEDRQQKIGRQIAAILVGKRHDRRQDEKHQRQPGHDAGAEAAPDGGLAARVVLLP